MCRQRSGLPGVTLDQPIERSTKTGIRADHVQKAAQRCLLAKPGETIIVRGHVALSKDAFGDEEATFTLVDEAARLFVRGGGLTPGVSILFASCCTPVPGDRIVGIVQPGQGLTVHVIDCERLVEFESQDDLWRDLQWTPQAERLGLGSATLKASIRNAPGVLGQACTIIGEAGGNILNLRMTHRKEDFFEVVFEVEVTDAKHATTIAAALRANPSVETVERMKG